MKRVAKCFGIKHVTLETQVWYQIAFRKMRGKEHQDQRAGSATQTTENCSAPSTFLLRTEKEAPLRHRNTPISASKQVYVAFLKGHEIDPLHAWMVHSLTIVPRKKRTVVESMDSSCSEDE